MSYANIQVFGVCTWVEVAGYLSISMSSYYPSQIRSRELHNSVIGCKQKVSHSCLLFGTDWIGRSIFSTGGSCYRNKSWLI